MTLTLPASFDEAARELTIEAAAQAGLKRIVLLEEPQAGDAPKLHITLDYTVRPFAAVEQEYLELFEQYRETGDERG